MFSILGGGLLIKVRLCLGALPRSSKPGCLVWPREGTLRERPRERPTKGPLLLVSFGRGAPAREVARAKQVALLANWVWPWALRGAFHGAFRWTMSRGPFAGAMAPEVPGCQNRDPGGAKTSPA